MRTRSPTEIRTVFNPRLFQCETQKLSRCHWSVKIGNIYRAEVGKVKCAADLSGVDHFAGRPPPGLHSLRGLCDLFEPIPRLAVTAPLILYVAEPPAICNLWVVSREGF
jgi:hypothetical protein